MKDTAERIRALRRPVGIAVMALAFAVAAGAEEPLQHRLIVKSFIDFGHIVNGSNPNDPQGNPDITMLPLNRANVLAIQEVTAGRFDVSAGLSGLIWWPYGGGITDADERVMQVKPMIPVARVRWQFGSPSGISGALMLGTFNYKYNSDAKNLGEYLYRSGTYPGFLWTTEGWLLMNRAGNYSHGVMLSLAQFNGMLKHSFSLFMETQYFPVGDFSPGYDGSFTSKWFELGGGVVLNHYLPLHPSALRPKDGENTYIRQVTGVDSTGDTAYYIGPNFNSVDINDSSVTVLHRWTTKGVKLMGRAAVNLGYLLPPEIRGTEDLRVFAEAAVLGWENQPLYYEKRSERIPVMFGINLPTFRMLDVLTLQAEYYRSPFNDIDKYNSSSLPIWEAHFAKDGLGTILTDSTGKVIPASVHDDDWKWSVYAKKAINKAVTVYVQAASDHLRLMSGPRQVKTSSIPLTSSPSEWYYLIRMEFSLR